MLLILLAIAYGLLVTLGPISAVLGGRFKADWWALCAVLFVFVLPGAAMCFRYRPGYYIVTAVVVLQLAGSFLGSGVVMLLVLLRWLVPSSVSMGTAELGPFVWQNLLSLGGSSLLACILLRRDVRLLFRKVADASFAQQSAPQSDRGAVTAQDDESPAGESAS